MKKGIKILILIIVSTILLILLMWYLHYARKTYEYTDITKYREYIDKLSNDKNAFTKMFIFPSEINTDNVEEFEYIKKDGLFDNSYLFYIIVKYNEKDYLKEVERIKKIKRIFNGKDKFILEVEGQKYPTYVTICDGVGTYEYAMLDNDNKKIIYVFRQLYDSNNKLNNEYVLNYNVPRNLRDKTTSGYNMYYLYDNYGVGHMEKDD